MKYTKKPVEIEAVQFNGFSFGVDHQLFSERPEWLTNEIGKSIRIVSYDGGKNLDIRTLEGVMRVSKGDYIIRGVKGELYPCKPDIFEATYDESKTLDAKGRVIAELTELNEKYNSLMSFKNSAGFYTLSVRKQDQLHRQSIAMHAYIEELQYRLDTWDE